MAKKKCTGQYGACTCKKSEEHPVWHGTDGAAKREAITRARKIRGYVILSRPPEDKDGIAIGMGYWSDSQGFLRNWETQIYSYEEEHWEIERQRG